MTVEDDVRGLELASDFALAEAEQAYFALEHERLKIELEKERDDLRDFKRMLRAYKNRVWTWEDWEDGECWKSEVRSTRRALKQTRAKLALLEKAVAYAAFRAGASK